MSKSVFVRHKANKAMPNLRAVIYCIRKLIFAKKVKVTMVFDQSIKGAETGGTVWLKVCGFKSGVRTKCNNENLVALRVVQLGEENHILETCEYHRRKSDLEFKNLKAQAVPQQIIEVSHIIERQGLMFIPAWGWAEGGGKYSLGSFQYWLRIERV
jgi:hypothetical protein